MALSPWHVFSTTRATSCCDTLGGNAEIAYEYCVSQGLWKIHSAGLEYRQQQADSCLLRLPYPFLFHYFTFHLEWRLKVSQRAVISPRRLLSVCHTTESELNTALCTFWQIPRPYFCLSVLLCFSQIRVIVVFRAADITFDSFVSPVLMLMRITI